MHYLYSNLYYVILVIQNAKIVLLCLSDTEIFQKGLFKMRNSAIFSYAIALRALFKLWNFKYL